jgi:hypothetical protein
MRILALIGRWRLTAVVVALCGLRAGSWCAAAAAGGSEAAGAEEEPAEGGRGARARRRRAQAAEAAEAEAAEAAALGLDVPSSQPRIMSADGKRVRRAELS